jgi:hypothetical protein
MRLLRRRDGCVYPWTAVIAAQTDRFEEMSEAEAEAFLDKTMKRSKPPAPPAPPAEDIKPIETPSEDKPRRGVKPAKGV